MKHAVKPIHFVENMRVPTKCTAAHSELSA